MMIDMVGPVPVNWWLSAAASLLGLWLLWRAYREEPNG